MISLSSFSFSSLLVMNMCSSSLTLLTILLSSSLLACSSLFEMASSALSFLTIYFFLTISLLTSLKLTTANTHSQKDFAAKFICLISFGLKLDVVFSLFFIVCSTLGGIWYTSRFLRRLIKLTSEMVFLTDYQSSFYCRRTLTHSRVNFTMAWGFWFIFISDMSFLLRVLRASFAAWRAGKASFRILSASFFSSRAFSVFSSISFSYSSTTSLTLLASSLSTSSFLRRFSCSTVLISRMGFIYVNFTFRSSIVLLASSSLWTPLLNLLMDPYSLILCSFRRWLKVYMREM